MGEPTTNPPATPGLARRLGPWTAITVVVGNVIGAGIFFMPSEVTAHVPYTAVGAAIWIGCGLFALCGALALAEVAVRFPRAGGNYVFLREAYGPVFGFLWGWVAFWIIGGAGIAALAVKFTDHLAGLLWAETGMSPMAHLGVTLGLLVGLALVNLASVRSGGLVQSVSTGAKILLLLAIALIPLVDFLRPSPVASVANLRPALPGDWHVMDVARLTAAFVAVVWVYDGWMHVTSVAEEVRAPERNLPLALLGGTGLVILLYLGANLAYALVISPAGMIALHEQAVNLPVAGVFAERLIGPAGGRVVTAAVLCSIFGILNGCFLVYPRVLYAMSRDGLAPAPASRVHARRQTPGFAIATLMLWACLLVVASALYQRMQAPGSAVSLFDPLLNLSMFGTLSLQPLAVSSVFVFRGLAPLPGTYRCWGYPITPLLYVASMVAVLVAQCITRPGVMFSGLAIMLAGAGYYVLRRGH